MIAATLILAFVTAQRLAELVWSRRNASRLLARGAREHGAGHYPAIVAVHAAWLAGLWILAPGREVEWAWIVVFGVFQIGRVWTLWTLGPRWTTRIIVPPGEPLVRRGPFRFVDHPNYLVVAGEIAALPLAFGLVGFALVFSIANAAVLFVRIRAEAKALAGLPRR